MFLRKVAPIVLAGAIIAFSCKKEKGPVVAKVGNLKVYKAEIEVQVPEGFRNNPSVTEDIKRQYLDEVLLYKAAKDEGLLKDEELRAQIRVAEVKVTAQYYLQNKLGNIAVDENEVMNEFSKTKDYFGQKYDMVVLYYADQSKTSAYRTLLMNPYPVIASEVNKLSPQEVQVAPLSENLGVIYYTYGPQLFNVISKLKIGEISDPVQLPGTQYFVLIKLVGVSKENYSDEQIKDFLRRTLLTVKQSAMRDSLITALRNKYRLAEVSEK